MRKTSWRKLRRQFWLPCLMASACGSFAQQPGDWSYSWLEEPPGDVTWPRHFRLGLLAGLNLKADFRMSGNFTMVGSQPGAAMPGIDHFYDDGYVRVDQNGNAGNVTSFWGYNNASQASGGSLNFHSVTSFDANGSSSGDGDVQLGLDVAYGGQLVQYHNMMIGWELGFGWLSVDIEADNSIAVVANRTIHNYSPGGIILPDAPYNGGSSGEGPHISDVPTGSTGTINGTLTGHTLEASLYHLRFGPTVHWELPARFALQLGGGAAVGFVTGGLSFNERLQFTDGTSAQNRGEVNDDKFVYGGYVGATLLYHTVEHGDFYIGAQYMPLGSATFSGGGREAELDMSGGLYISAGINWPF